MRYMQRLTPSDPVANQLLNTLPFADGGSVSHLGPFRIHTFTQDDAATSSMWQNRNGDSTVWNYTTSMTVHQGGMMDILIVGGGGGGSCMGGGGGAGGYLLYQNITVTPGQKIVQVGGGGGSEFTHDGFQQTAGGPSFFADLVALGGGAGAGYSYPSPSQARFSGGSGGGAGQSPRPANPVPAGLGTPGQGHPGGNGWHGSQHAGGGGGGAAQPGWPANPSIPYNSYVNNGPEGRWRNLYPPNSPYANFPVQQKGGNGLANDITGFSQHYAGGGGGGGHPSHANNRTAGGLGGGGEGTCVAVGNFSAVTDDTYHLAGQPGQRNTGSGGGGSTHSSHQNTDSGRGGPGIVVVRYRAR